MNDTEQKENGSPSHPSGLETKLRQIMELLDEESPSHPSGLETWLELLMKAGTGKSPSHPSGLETSGSSEPPAGMY